MDAAARQSSPEQISPSTQLFEQINFARHTFENQQSTIRAADTKVGALLTILFIVAVVAIPIGREAIPRLHWSQGASRAAVSTVFLASAIVFVVSVLRSLMLVVTVVRPRGVSGRSPSNSPGQLLFYKHVLQYRDANEYFGAVSNATPELLLRNLTDQVFDLSRICSEKMAALDDAKDPLMWALYSFAVVVALGIWLGVRG